MSLQKNQKCMKVVTLETHFFKQKFFSSLYKQNAKEIIEQIDN